MATSKSKYIVARKTFESALNLPLTHSFALLLDYLTKNKIIMKNNMCTSMPAIHIRFQIRNETYS